MKNINNIVTYSARGKEKIRTFERRKDGVYELVKDTKGETRARPILRTLVWVQKIKGVFPAQFKVCWFHGSEVRWEWLPMHYLMPRWIVRWVREHNIPYDSGIPSTATYLESEVQRAERDGRAVYEYQGGAAK